MRILKIANIPPGANTGMGRVMHSTAAALRNLGHQVDLMLGDDIPRRRWGRFDRFTFPIALVGAVRRRLVRGEHFDVVEIHEPCAAWYCFCRKRDRVLPPCVVMSHGLEAVQWRLRRRLDRKAGAATSWKSRMLVPATLLSQACYALRHCDVAMCLNSLDERFLRMALHLPAARVARVTHGVDEGFFVAGRGEQEKRPLRLLFVGSWLDKKGRSVLARSFDRWKAIFSNLQLSLIGTGMSSQGVLSTFAPQLHPSIQVRPQVKDEELWEIYRAHDIFVFPSYYEPWGLVLTEAAAAGMAIVTLGAGGPADFFRDGEDALLVSPRDEAGFRSAVERLINDPALRRRLGQAARKRAKEFTWGRAAQDHLRAYEQAIRNASAGDFDE